MTGESSTISTRGGAGEVRSAGQCWRPGRWRLILGVSLIIVAVTVAIMLACNWPYTQQAVRPLLHLGPGRQVGLRPSARLAVFVRVTQIISSRQQTYIAYKDRLNCQELLFEALILSQLPRGWAHACPYGGPAWICVALEAL